MSTEPQVADYVDTTLNTISGSVSVAEAGKKMIDLGVDSLLVLKDDVISGIVTQTDIMKAISLHTQVSDNVASIMSTPLLTIEKSAKVGDAIKKMRENSTRRLVVQENSNLIGTITQKKIFGGSSSQSIEIPELEIPKQIKCPYCMSLFDEKNALSKHIDQIHVGYGVFQGNFTRAEDLGSISPSDTYSKSV